MSGTTRWTTVLAAAGAVALVLPAPAVGQDGGEVLRTALERYESRLQGVRTVTVEHETETPMSGPTRSEVRLVKRTRDGRPVLVPEGDSATGNMPVSRFYASLPRLVEHATLRGRSTIDGHQVFVVHLAGLQDVDLGVGSTPSGDGSFEADSATLYVDTERYLFRRAEAHGRTSIAGAERALSVRAHMSDFREVDGFVYPYRTVARVNVEGLGGQMAAMLEKMRQSVRDSAQRAMLEQAAAAMSKEGMRIVTRVRELRINAEGPVEDRDRPDGERAYLCDDCGVSGPTHRRSGR